MNNLNLNVMKKTFLFVLMTIMSLSIGCKDDMYSIDERFVGVWENVEDPKPENRRYFYANGKITYEKGPAEWKWNKKFFCISVIHYHPDSKKIDWSTTWNVEIIIDGKEVKFNDKLYRKIAYN